MNFSISHRLNSKEYRQLTFSLLFAKIWFIIMLICAIVFVIGYLVLYLAHRLDLVNDNVFELGIAITFYSLFILILSWFRSAWLFKGNHRLTEMITYSFSDEGLTLKGDSFDSRYTWDKLYKVKIIKGWLMLYHGRTTAHLIKLSDDDQANTEQLKQFIKASNFKIKQSW